MEPQHDLEAWARETRFGRRTFNREFRMHGSEMRDWRLVEPTDMERESARWGSTYLWRRREQPSGEAVRVVIAELSDWREAQEHLRAMLLDSMDGQPPPAGSALSGLGDVMFVVDQSQSEDPEAVMFARGNIAVAIRNIGWPRADLVPFAEVIDGALGYTLPYLDLPAGAIEPWTIGTQTDGADQRLDVDLEGAGNSWVKVIAPGGELRESDGDLLYTGPATGPNDIQIIRIPAPRANIPPVAADAGRSVGMVVAGMVALLALLYLLARAAGPFDAP